MNQQLHHSILQRTYNAPPRRKPATSHRQLIFLILAFSACCSIVEKNNLLGKLSKFAHGIFSSYWHFLNQAIYFATGSHHGFSSLFAANPGWSFLVFIAPFVVGFFALKLFLKQSDCIHQHVIIFLYIWHSVSSFVHIINHA